MLALIKIRIQSVSKAIAGVIEDIHLSSVSFQYGDLTVTDVGENSYKIGSINTQKPILREEHPLTPNHCKSEEKVLNVISPIIIDRGGLRKSVGDVKQLANYDASIRNNIVASINDVIRRVKPLESTMPTIYVTDFTLAECDAAIANGGEMRMNLHSIWDAVAANKIIFIPRGDTGGGCVALSSISDDYVYLTCIDNHIGVVYHIEVAPDGAGFIYSSRWRFLLKTINGESLLGEGDITTPTSLRIGDADDEAKANFIAVANGEKSADYYICSSRVQGMPVDGIVTNIVKTGPAIRPIYVSYTFYGSPTGGGLAGKLLKITTTLTVSTGVITTTYEAVLDAKQDAITDLEDIREGAAKGATAVQPEDIKDEVYIADFTMESLMYGMNNSSQVDCDMQALVAAMNDNKIILVREGADSAYKGVYVLNGYAEDFLYFSIVDSQGNVLYCEGTDYEHDSGLIDGRTLHVRRWADKQDILVSGENIKTINGKSIVGSGDIVIEGGTAASGVYIADFYMHQLRGGEYIPFDVQALQEAIEANKIIYIPYDVNDGSQGGCVATALIEDMIYLTIFGDMGDVYLVEIDFGSTDIDPQRITERDPILSINDVPVAMDMVIRPRQRKLNVSNGQTLGLVLHNYFSIVQPLSNVTLSLPSVAEENNVQQCGVTFTTGTSNPVVRYIGGTIWWEGGVAPTIVANAVVEFIFTWHWQKSAWLGKCTIYKAS